MNKEEHEAVKLTVKVGVSEGMKDAWNHINENTADIAEDRTEIALLKKDAEQGTASQHEQGKRLGTVETTQGKHSSNWRTLWYVATLLTALLGWLGAKLIDKLFNL